jgi:predicted MPP superfamily phosphohydrolase
VDPEADLRILLCHFPDVVGWLEPDEFDLTLAGHLHGGQICIPTPRGKLRLEHLRALHWEGLHQTVAGPLYVSRGLGTSFVPFRFLARPEATLLRLERAH